MSHVDYFSKNDVTWFRISNCAYTSVKPSSVQSVCSSQVSTTLRFPEETRVDSVYAKVTEPIEVSMQVLYYAKQASASVVLI